MLKQIEQDYRVCSVCEKRTLSGIAHIDRGNLTAFLCYGCAKDGSGLDRLKQLTRNMWRQIKERQRASRDLT
jgi:hypothetical protein